MVKKEYEQPNVEIVKFDIGESLMDDLNPGEDLSGDFGTGTLPPLP